MSNYIKLIVLGLVVLFAAIGSNYARDLAYQVHAILVMLIAGGLFIWTLRNTEEPDILVDRSGEYMDDVIRYGVIATAFWGVVGFLAGTFIAFQLAFPALNFEWAQPYMNFEVISLFHYRYPFRPSDSLQCVCLGRVQLNFTSFQRERLEEIKFTLTTPKVAIKTCMKDLTHNRK